MGTGVRAQDPALVAEIADTLSDILWGERERNIATGEVYRLTPGPEQAWNDAPYVIQRLQMGDGATMLATDGGDSERVLVIGELITSGTTTIKFDPHALEGRQELWLLDGGGGVSGTLIIDGSGRNGQNGRGSNGPLVPGQPGMSGMTIGVNLVAGADEVVDRASGGGSVLAAGRIKIVSRGGNGGEGDVGWEGSSSGRFRVRTQGRGGDGGGGGRVELRLHIDTERRTGNPAFYDEREVSPEDWTAEYSSRLGVDIDVTPGAGGIPTQTRRRRGETGSAGAPGQIVWGLGQSAAHVDQIESFRQIMRRREAAAGAER